MKLVLCLIFCSRLYAFSFWFDFFSKPDNIDALESYVSSLIEDKKDFPVYIDLDGSSYSFKTTLDDELTQYIVKMLNVFPSDLTNIAVIDNTSGAVISLLSVDSKSKKNNVHRALYQLHPSASLFKVVTAADLVEQRSIGIEHEYLFQGKSTTLYRSQLKEVSPSHRWSRSINLREAFAKSNNPVMARASLIDSSLNSIMKMAKKLGFNNNNVQFFKLPPSKTMIINDDFQLAELASGFNRETSMNVIHAAYLSSVIANNGMANRPYIISSIYNLSMLRLAYQANLDRRRRLSEKSSLSLQELMRATVKEGTARGSFKKFNQKYEQKYLYGGKTGSITGLNPYGKRDWFTAFIKTKDSTHAGYSIAVLINNEKKWYVKASFLSAKIMEFLIEKKYFESAKG